jgi:hypothetical protein
MGNPCPRTSEGLTQKTAKRCAKGERSPLRAFQNELEWRGARASHGVGFLHWRAGVVVAGVAVAVVSLVMARRTGASSRHCRRKPAARRLKAKPNRRESVRYFSRCDPRESGWNDL